MRNTNRFELVIGAEQNTRTQLYRGYTNQQLSNVKSENILDCNEYRFDRLYAPSIAAS